MIKLKQFSAVSIVFVLAASVLIAGPTVVASGESMDSLNFKIEGHYMGEPAVFEYWFKNINAENELFRLIATRKGEDKVLMGWIRDKEKDVYYKDIENTRGTWRQIPNGETAWQKMKNRILSERSASFWHENEGKDVYEVMEVEEGEEEEVRIYEISVNEPIKESIFEPE